MIKQLVHVNLVVKDIERSMRFYTEFLGAKIIRDWPGESSATSAALGMGERVIKWHAYMLRWGDGNLFPQIDLLEYIDPPSQGEPYDSLNHVGIPRICLEVDDIQIEYERLLGLGVQFVSAPVQLDPNTRRGSVTYICCLYDPDGIVIELLGPVGSGSPAGGVNESSNV